MLASEHDVPLDPAGYVEACHLCYRVRQGLAERFPDELTPSQVYGD